MGYVILKKATMQKHADDPAKLEILRLWEKNVRGVNPSHAKLTNHCGSEGHWLERQFGVQANSNNAPDIFGYEMKKQSRKITFGDFQASEYLFSEHKPMLNTMNGLSIEVKMSRSEFIKHFGMPNPKKNGRYSWSGKCVPKYGSWNTCGQTLRITDDNHIVALYSRKYDKREIRLDNPLLMSTDNEVAIAIWHADKMRRHINNKFNENGWFICLKHNGVYHDLQFGKPFNFESFIDGIKNNKIIFDSGMYDGNTRNYSQFRSNMKDFWNDYFID
jgi:hypothetical protein